MQRGSPSWCVARMIARRRAPRRGRGVSATLGRARAQKEQFAAAKTTPDWSCGLGRYCRTVGMHALASVYDLLVVVGAWPSGCRRIGWRQGPSRRAVGLRGGRPSKHAPAWGLNRGRNAGRQRCVARKPRAMSLFVVGACTPRAVRRCYRCAGCLDQLAPLGQIIDSSSLWHTPKTKHSACVCVYLRDMQQS